MATQPINHDVLTADEVAEMSRLDRGTVVRYAKRGKIPGKKIGYVWRFSRVEIEKMLPGDVQSSRGKDDAEEPEIQTGTH